MAVQVVPPRVNVVDVFESIESVLIPPETVNPDEDDKPTALSAPAQAVVQVDLPIVNPVELPFPIKSVVPELSTLFVFTPPPPLMEIGFAPDVVRVSPVVPAPPISTAPVPLVEILIEPVRKSFPHPMLMSPTMAAPFPIDSTGVPSDPTKLPPMATEAAVTFPTCKTPPFESTRPHFIEPEVEMSMLLRSVPATVKRFVDLPKVSDPVVPAPMERGPDTESSEGAVMVVAVRPPFAAMTPEAFIAARVDVPVTPRVVLARSEVPETPAFAVINPDAVTAATVDSPVTPRVVLARSEVPETPAFAVINPDAVTAATVDSPVTPRVVLARSEVPETPAFAVINPDAVTAATVDSPVTPSAPVDVKLDAECAPEFTTPRVDVPVTPRVVLARSEVPETPPFAVISPDAITVERVDDPVTPSAPVDVKLDAWCAPEVTPAKVESPETPRVEVAEIVVAVRPPLAATTPEAFTAATVESPVTPSVPVDVKLEAECAPEFTPARVERPDTPRVVLASDVAETPPFAVSSCVVVK